MPLQYRLHWTESKHWGPWLPEIDDAMVATRRRFREVKAGSNVVIKPRGRTWNDHRAWSPEMKLPEAFEVLERRFDDPGSTWLIKPVKYHMALAIRSGELYTRPELPADAVNWPRPLPDIYTFCYGGRYPDWLPYLGVFSCRLTRQGGSYSYHSWRQAIDVGITRPDGTNDHRLALQIEADVTREFGKALMYVVTYKEDPTYHFNHNHIQVTPDRTGQVPSCVRG